MTILSVAETARLLNVTSSRVRQLCRSGRLGHTHPRHGAAWVITREELGAYLATGPLEAGRPALPETPECAPADCSPVQSGQ